MQPDIIVVKFGELFLKSKSVRRLFERQLLNNIKACFQENKVQIERIDLETARFLVRTKNIDDAVNALQKVFGISQLNLVVEVGAQLNAISTAAAELATHSGLTAKKSFAVRANRVTKDFPTDSNAIASSVGSFVQEETKAKVDLSNPDVEIFIDVLKTNAFVYTKIIKGLGGLPVGTAGKIVCLVKDKNSAIAAWLMLKRGAKIITLCFGKVSGFEKLIEALKDFSSGVRIEYKQIDSAPTKSEMIKEAEKFASEKGAKAICVGSTDLDDMDLAPESKIPIFTPLIGLEKKDVAKLGQIIFKRE